MIPNTVSELYPSKWLKAADLNGRSFTLTVTAVTVEPIRNPSTNQNELKAILDFGRSKRLILNVTQCHEITAITGSDIFKEWAGHSITLHPATTRNGKATIHITKPNNSTPQDTTNE